MPDIAPPAAPASVPLTSSTLPTVADRLSVPASALGLETELPKDLLIPAKPDTNIVVPAAGPTGPAATGPSSAPSAPLAATGPANTSPIAATGPAPAATGATAPAAPTKVKLGDKEYTTAELEKILAERAQQNKQPAPAAPAAAPTPPPPAPTKEQVAAAEQLWCDNFIKTQGVTYPATEAELETLLGGGKESVEFFTKKLSEVTAKAVLLARKSIYDELNPQMEEFSRRIEPLFVNHTQVERVSTEQAFLRTYPEYQGQHIETARQVAEALVEKYPQVISKMPQAQFLATVQEQTDRILQAEYKRWNPNAADTWRDAAKRTSAPVVPAAPVSAVVPPVVPTAPATPAPADPWRTPPAPNSPASTPAAGAANWNKTVAQSLQD